MSRKTTGDQFVHVLQNGTYMLLHTCAFSSGHCQPIRLPPLILSSASFQSSVGKKGGPVGWYTKHTYSINLEEVIAEATWSSTVFFLGHTDKTNEWETFIFTGLYTFLLLFPWVYLTWLHLNYVSRLSSIHPEYWIPTSPRRPQRKIPWYDLLFFSHARQRRLLF